MNLFVSGFNRLYKLVWGYSFNIYWCIVCIKFYSINIGGKIRNRKKIKNRILRQTTQEKYSSEVLNHKTYFITKTQGTQTRLLQTPSVVMKTRFFFPYIIFIEIYISRFLCVHLLQENFPRKWIFVISLVHLCTHHICLTKKQNNGAIMISWIYISLTFQSFLLD